MPSKWEKMAGAMLEPAWLYADLGDDIKKNPLKILAETVKKYNCRGAVVHLGDLSEIYNQNCKKIVAVIDFPYGRGGRDAKGLESSLAHALGVIGLDVVINLWALQKQKWQEIEKELKAVKEVSHSKEIKVICQMPFVWQYHRDFILPLLETLVNCGVNAVKDWTTINNFSRLIKTDIETRIEYINYLRILINENEFPLLIKVAGGVDKNNVVAFKKAGADIFGVSCHKIPKVIESLANHLKE